MLSSQKNPVAPKKQAFCRAAIIVLLVLLIYAPVFQAGYIWDDTVMLTENSFVKSNEGLLGIWAGKTVDYLPVTLSMLWLEWRIFGVDPTGYHIINGLLHALGAIFLWRVLLRLKIPGAWLGALLFAVHPVCVASVAWISERKNTLSLVFYLLSLLFYLRFAGNHDSSDNQTSDSRPSTFSPQLFYWLSLIAFLLALLSKPSTVVLPVVLLLCVWWRQNKINRSDFVRTIPFFAAALVISAVTIWFQNHKAIGDTPFAADSLIVRLLGGSWAVWFYLWKDLVPVNLSMIYPRWTIDPASSLSYLPGAAWLGLLFLLWRLGKAAQSVRAASRAVFFALAYFWITLWPVLGLFNMYFLVYAQAADHWQYLSLIAICAVAGASIALLHGKARKRSRSLEYFLTCSVTLAVASLSFLTWQRARVFVNSESLWRDTLTKNPAAWVAHNNLGNALEERGDSLAAEKYHAEALRLGPKSPDAHYNMAKHLARRGETETAIAHYRAALRLAPSYTKAHNNLGIILEAKGQADEALDHYAEAVRLSPGYAVAQNNLGQLLLKKGKVDEALTHGLAALRLNPDFAEAHYNIANAYSFQRKAPESARHFQEALRLRPDYPEAHYNFGNLLAAQGKIEDARQHFIAAVRLRPGFADAQNNLGNTFAVQGKWAEAASCYAEVLRIDPAHPIAQSSLGYALFRQNRFPEAEAQLSAALKRNPSSPEDHFNLGLVYSRLGRKDFAKTHYAEALELRPDFAEAHFQLALFWMGKNKNADAVEHLRAAVKLRPKWREALNNLAWILSTASEGQLRNGPEALELAKRATEISVDPGTLDTLAAAHAAAQQFSEAASAAAKAIDLAEESGQKKLADEIRSRLKLYQSARPYREAAGPTN